MVPEGEAFEALAEQWLSYASDPGCTYDSEVHIDAATIRPMITYGTHPGHAMPVDAPVPHAADESDAKALGYMNVVPGQPMLGTHVDRVFIGSCTNSRIDDIRAAAAVFRGRQVREGLRAIVVPGSEAVKAEAEAEGLHQIILAAGAEWREPGCSMCIAMNGDRAEPGELVVSTSNRNFAGRQGPGARTVLASPATAAAAAVTGVISDVRELKA